MSIVPAVELPLDVDFRQGAAHAAASKASRVCLASGPPA